MFDFQQQGLNCRGDYSGSPLMLNGIYSPVAGNWTALLGHGCGNPNPGGGRGGVDGGAEEDPGTNTFLFSSAVGAGYNGVRPIQEGKIAAFAAELQSGATRSQYLDAYLGGAIAYLDDPEIPTAGLLSHSIDPAQWTQGTETRTVTASATDPGLGVKYFNLEPRGTDGQFAFLSQAQHPCTATRQSRCPRNWSATLPYDTTTLPEGITDYQIRAFDPGTPTTPKAPNKPGRSKSTGAPRRFIATGPLRDSAGGDVEATADLHIATTDGLADGTSVNARSGIKSVEVQVDGQRADYAEKPSPCATCSLSLDWAYSSADYTTGTHTVTVIATDQIGGPGHTTSQSWQVSSTPTTGGNHEDTVDEADSGQTEDLGSGTEPFCYSDPESQSNYCGQEDATNPTDVAADLEVPLDPTATDDYNSEPPTATAASVAPPLVRAVRVMDWPITRRASSVIRDSWRSGSRSSCRLPYPGM